MAGHDRRKSGLTAHFRRAPHGGRPLMAIIDSGASSARQRPARGRHSIRVAKRMTPTYPTYPPPSGRRDRRGALITCGSHNLAMPGQFR